MAAERVRCVAAKKATIILYPAQMAQLADLLNEFSEALHTENRGDDGDLLFDVFCIVDRAEETVAAVPVKD